MCVDVGVRMVERVDRARACGEGVGCERVHVWGRARDGGRACLDNEHVRAGDEADTAAEPDQDNAEAVMKSHACDADPGDGSLAHRDDVEVRNAELTLSNAVCNRRDSSSKAKRAPSQIW